MGQKIRNSRPGGLFDLIFRRQLPLETETTVFIFVSALDIFMTWTLLTHGGFIESNPLARYFLDHWGKKGFVGFKFAMVAFICLITQIIALKKPETARNVLNLGSVVVFFVVVYSLTLLLKHGRLF